MVRSIIQPLLVQSVSQLSFIQLGKCSENSCAAQQLKDNHLFALKLKYSSEVSDMTIDAFYITLLLRSNEK